MISMIFPFAAAETVCRKFTKAITAPAGKSQLED
jgi:hypothetical protein